MQKVRGSSPRRSTTTLTNHVRRRFGAGVLAFMAIALVAWTLLHTPLGRRLDEVLGTAPECVSLCGPVRPILEPIAALLLIASAAAAAWCLTLRIALRGRERPLGWGLLFFGLVTVPAAYVAGLGDVIGHDLAHPPLGPFLAALPSLAIVTWSAWRGWRAGTLAALLPRPSMPARPNPLALWLGVLTAGLLTLSAGVALAHPPTGYDELGYHLPLAMLLWSDGSLTEPLTRLGSAAMASPGSAELWFGLLYQAGGEPLMILGQLPFALLGALAVASIGRDAGLPSRAAVLGGLAFLLAPLVAIQVGRGADDVLGASLVLAVAALLLGVPERLDARRLALLGLGLGLAAATKLALLPAAGVLGLVALVLLFRARGRLAPGAAIPAAIALIVAALVIVAPWWIRNLIMFGNPIYPADVPIFPRAVSQATLEGKDLEHVPSRWLWPLYPLLEPIRHDSGFGPLFLAAALPGVVIAAFLARGRRVLWAGLALAVTSVIAWWALTRHEPRFLLDVAGLAFALVGFVLAGVTLRWRRPAAVLIGVVALVSVGATVATGLAEDAAAPTGRIAFYKHVWNVDAFVQALPSSRGLLLDDDCPGSGLPQRVYPLLGPDQSRSVARITCTASQAEIQHDMRHYRLSDVFVVRAQADAAAIAAQYPPDRFDLIYQRDSRVTDKRPGRTFRVYQLKTPA